MADPIAVAGKRARAELRVRNIAPVLAERFGVSFTLPAVNQAVYPDLYGAELMEQVASLLESISEKRK